MAVVKLYYDIPDELHRRIKIQAAVEGITLKQFVVDALEAAAERSESKPNGRGGRRKRR